MISLNGVKVILDHFPDGSLHITYENNSADVIPMPGSISILKWNYESDEELFAVYCIGRKLATCGIVDHHVVLDMPYIPNARMDRVKSGYELFTLKFFSEIINSCGFKYVNVLDPHSNVSEALINSVLVTYPLNAVTCIMEGIKRNISNDFLLFFPDEGSCKRYGDFFKVPQTFGIKKRDWSTGKILGLDIINPDLIKDKTILIVDDICSKGGTFYFSAKKLKELGAKNIYLYVSHCENTILEGDLISSGLITKIFTTDSIFTKKHELIVPMHYNFGHIYTDEINWDDKYLYTGGKL